MASLDTHWTALPLSKRDTQKKYTAIKRYASQVAASSRFLYSFARHNEIFGTLGTDNRAPGLARVPDGAIRVDGSAGDWAGQTPVALDPSGDSVGRVVQSDADIVRVFTCRDSRFLYVRMDMAQAVSPQVAYTLTLRPILPSGGPNAAEPPAQILSLLPGPAGHAAPLPGVPGGTYAWCGSLLEAALPLSAVSLTHPVPGETLYVMGQTRFADVEIDRTGFRAVACGPEAVTRTAQR